MPRIISILGNSLSFIHIMMSLLSVHFHLDCIVLARHHGEENRDFEVAFLNLSPDDDGGGAPSVKIVNDRKEKTDRRLIRMAQRLDVVQGQSIASSSLDIRTGHFSSSDGK